MVCILVVHLNSIDANASELSVGVSETFLELKPESNGKISSKAQFRIGGGQKAKITIQLCDLYVNEDGLKELLPLGATPNSPKGILEIGPYQGAYIPNGRVQTFEVEILSVGVKPINNSITGGLRITVDPTPFENGKSTYRAIGLALTFVYSPKNQSALTIKSGIQNTELEILNPKLSPASRLWLPELSFLKSSGPIELKYQQTNNGNIFQVVTDVVTVRKLGSPKENLIFEARIKNRLLLPNQKLDKNLTVIDKSINSNREINPIGWGIYKIRIISTGNYLGAERATVLNEKNFIVFPWKQFLVILIFALALLRRRLKVNLESKLLLEKETKIIPLMETKSTPTREVPKKTPVKKVAKKTPVKKVAKKTPVKKVAKKTPVKKVAKTVATKDPKNLR